MDFPILLSLLTIVLGLVATSWFKGSDAPYFVTKKSRIHKLLKIVSVKGKTFYELGSGDGRLVIEAAKLGAHSIGIENSLLRVLLSKLKARQLKNAHFIYQNIFNLNYKNADIIYTFLLPPGIEKLENKLKKEVKTDCIVVTQTFHFKNWKPYKKVLINDSKNPSTLIGKNKFEGDFWLYKK